MTLTTSKAEQHQLPLGALQRCSLTGLTFQNVHFSFMCQSKLEAHHSLGAHWVPAAVETLGVRGGYEKPVAIIDVM